MGATTSQPAKVSVAAEGRRNKVPLEKGYSQVDWLRLAKSGTDFTDGHGRRPGITLEEVRQHKTKDNAWVVLQGKVYNITPYLKYHPGGVDILAKTAGRDVTSLFNKYHPWVNAHALLEKCFLGRLQQHSVQPDTVSPVAQQRREQQPQQHVLAQHQLQQTGHQQQQPLSPLSPQPPPLPPQQQQQPVIPLPLQQEQVMIPPFSQHQ
eukprot:GHRR01014606.1.p1 GENE.GHRR01014606.1~~GHRR01014606.1.p1  ORF type:complete len:207 (+),score=72.25 GHRR01014606.1:250-870(+)